MLVFWCLLLQKGHVFKALFRVNAHNRLEVCHHSAFPIFFGLFVFDNVHIMHVLSCAVRPIAKSMEFKRIFSLMEFQHRIEL